MRYYIKKSESKKIDSKNGHYSFPLLSEKNGCVKGCNSGICVYENTEYLPATVHNDQEGFYVLEGKGTACINRQEFEVEKDMSILVPASTSHQFKCCDAEKPLVMFYFHAEG